MKRLLALWGTLIIVVFTGAAVYLLAAYMVSIMIGGFVLAALISTPFLVQFWHLRHLPIKQHQTEAQRLSHEQEIERERLAIEREHIAREDRRADEKHALELQLVARRFDLEQHVTLTRVLADERGHYPYIVSQAQDGPIYQHLPNPHISTKQIAAQGQAKDPNEGKASSGLIIPAKYDLRTIWQDFSPSAEQIFLGMTAQGPIYVPIRMLWHIALTGPTGGGKCLEENEPIFLADGRVLPAKFLIGKSVDVIGVVDTDTMRQMPTLASFTDNGTRLVFEIELDNGVVLKRTEEHPLWEAQLNENQHVGLYRKNKPGKRSPRTRAINAGWVQAKDLRTCGNRPNFDGHVILCPTTIQQKGTFAKSDNEVVLCAVLLAEGCLTSPNLTAFTSASPEIVSCISQAVDFYGCQVSPRSLKQQPIIDYVIVKASRAKKLENKVNTLVREWGMQGCSALNKRIPQWVFQLPDEQIALFLRVFIDCDGWFDDGTNRNPSVCVSLANANLVQQIGQLAKRLGISGTYTHKGNSHTGSWTWSSPMVDVWQEKVGSLIKAEALGRAVRDKATRHEMATTDWNEWRQARPIANQTFADCPTGYEWRKVKSVRTVIASTVSIEVHNDNHAYVGYAVEHNTSILRKLLMQLAFLKCHLTLCDIHYAPIKEDGNGKPIDWRPIEKRLAQTPIRDINTIADWMNWLAYGELQARIDRQYRGEKIGRPLFFTIEELPAVLDEAGDKVSQPLAKILRQGRQYFICFVGASQDLLTKTLNMSQGPRECFRTGYYTGGDPHTAKALLDLSNGEKIDEEGIGIDGLVYLKTAMHQAMQTRVGWASNEALYELLDVPMNERLGRPGSPVIDADMPDLETFRRQNHDGPDASRFTIVQPVEQSDVTSEERPKEYKLSDVEIPQFITGYKACGNIDKALSALGRGGRYKRHASELVRIHNLRKEA